IRAVRRKTQRHTRSLTSQKPLERTCPHSHVIPTLSSRSSTGVARKAVVGSAAPSTHRRRRSRGSCPKSVCCRALSLSHEEGLFRACAVAALHFFSRRARCKTEGARRVFSQPQTLGEFRNGIDRLFASPGCRESSTALYQP